MEKIPKNCIKSFKKRYEVYPSILDFFCTNYEEKIKSYFSKSLTLWRKETHTDDGSVYVDTLLDYDPTGIMVYIKNNKHIFILTTENRMDVAKLTLTRLKKILKENGNNS